MDVAESLRILMHAMDLSYGAIDMRLTPNGCYVFLGINPAGQFLYIKEATAQPITLTMASFLAEPRCSAVTRVPQVASAEYISRK